MRRISILLVILFIFYGQNFAQKCSDKNNAANFSNQQSGFTTVYSDSINILKYTINLNITDFTNKQISGNTEIKFLAKENGLTKLKLDLLKLIVDSVEIAGTNLTFNYNTTLLSINLPAVLNANDSAQVKIFYRGKPQFFPTSFGGFYFENGYAFNIGVGIGAAPPNYGRVWFPCIDNFTDRALYEFNIITNNGKQAVCNGYLAADSLDTFGNRTRKWIMEQPIPTYLACVAVGNFTPLIYTYQGINKSYPIQLTAVAADTINVKNSFVNLNSILNIFENSFGPYQWNKVGYSFIPFNFGAMEHATNIAYPRAFADGSLNFQFIYAHELSHHWFGNLITCSTAADMWINEGWASYCEKIVTENLSGYSNYLTEMRVLHESNLQFIIAQEGALALSAIPAQYTYGNHVYLRGPEVVHSLRGYLGDSLFFASVRSYLSKNKYHSVSSTDLMNGLSQESGKNLNNFFQSFVFNPGWSHFSIDSFQSVLLNGKYKARVFVKQKLTAAPNYFQEVPLTLTFKNANFTEFNAPIVMNGATGFFEIAIPFDAKFVAINMDEKIALAIAPEFLVVKNPGTYTLTNAKFTLIANEISDSAFVRVEHNYTAPDSIKLSASNYTISPNHYWKVDGILPVNFKAKASIPYNGKASSFSGTEWLDNNLIKTADDKIFVLYRKNASSDWILFPHQTRSIQGSANLKRGFISIDSLWLGEYAMAVQKVNTGLELNVNQSIVFNLFPNPSNELINIEFKKSNFKTSDEISYLIMDVNGRIVRSQKIKSTKGATLISVADLAVGTYIVSIHCNAKSVVEKKFIKQ